MRPGAACLGAASVVWVIGCSGAETLWIPRPPVEADARSVVLVFANEDHADFAIAAPLEAGALVGTLRYDDSDWRDALPERPQIRALYFSQPLEDLDLQPGRISGDQPRSCRLASPIATRQIAAGANDDRTWGESELTTFEAERDVLFGDRACQLPNLCGHLTQKTLQLPAITDVNTLIPIDDHTALLGVGYAGGLYRVTKNEVTTSTVHRALQSYANFLTPDRELWLGGRDGVVVHGPIDGPFTSIDIPDLLTLTVSAIDVDPDTGDVLAFSLYDPHDFEPPAPSEIAMVTLHRLRGGVWTELHRSVIRNGKVSAARIIRHGRDKAVVVYRDYTVLAIDGDRIEQRATSEDGFLQPFIGSAARHGDDLYFGGSDGDLYVDEGGDGDLLPVPGATLSGSIDSIFVWDDALFLGGSEGYFVEFDLHGVPCENELRAPSDVEVVVRVGDDLLLAGGNLRQNEPNFVTWVSITR